MSITEDATATGRKPRRGAREIINRDGPGRSQLDDPRCLKRPPSTRTRQRIARGLERLGINVPFADNR